MVRPQERAYLVDFIVTGAEGQPVTDLRPDEVSVRIGGDSGRVRTLRSMPALVEPDPRASRAGAFAFGDGEATAFARNFLLVVDDESLPSGSEQSTREAITAFLRRLGPQDRVGLASIPVDFLHVSPTTDHWRVSQVLRHFVGRGARQETATDAACRARRDLLALPELLRSASAVGGGGPLVLVLFSASLLDVDNDVQLTLGTPLACNLQASEFNLVAAEAARARAYVYIVQPETFAQLQWPMSARAGLEHLAGVTGGRILRLSGRDRDRLDRVDIEMSAVYVASVAMATAVRPGGIYDVSVKTSRPGATVYVRPKFAVPTR